MDLFEEIVNETFLIDESVSRDSVRNAIEGMHPVWITYNDEQGGGGKNRRLIYPVAYGLTTKGNEVIRAFQPQGSSKRGLTTPPNNREYPKWKYFRLDRIKFWRTVSSQTYTDDGMEGFDEGDDKSMSKVYLIAPIGGAKYIPKQKPDIGYKPITKQDVENIPTEEEPEETPEVTPIQQPRRYTARQVVNNLINRIKTFGGKVKDMFTSKNQQKNLDNTENTDNFTQNNNLTAPDTEPVTKQDVEQTVNNQPSTQTQSQQVPKPNDEPVSKEEVGTEETVDNNKLTNSFKDMMSRMNNLEK